VAFVIETNKVVRDRDEWFDDDPDDIPLLQRVLARIVEDGDPLVTAGR
jgi:hypothetical protein